MDNSDTHFDDVAMFDRFPFHLIRPHCFRIISAPILFLLASLNSPLQVRHWTSTIGELIIPILFLFLLFIIQIAEPVRESSSPHPFMQYSNPSRPQPPRRSKHFAIMYCMFISFHFFVVCSTCKWMMSKVTWNLGWKA